MVSDSLLSNVVTRYAGYTALPVILYIFRDLLIGGLRLVNCFIAHAYLISVPPHSTTQKPLRLKGLTFCPSILMILFIGL
jgi:hypothetical protein